MSRTRLAIVVSLGLISLLLSFATGIATEDLVKKFPQLTELAWPALAVLVPITILLMILEVKTARSADDSRAAAAGQYDTNRHGMLAKVRRDWIDGYLKPSLHNLARIELGLAETPDAVSRPWDVIVQQPDRAPRPLPPGQAMGDVFDELGQAMLILGAPGAGKTTLLLELARDLLNRAEQDATHPIPVVFHLSSWAARRRPLADWLVDELKEHYYVPPQLAQTWVDNEQVLPLLDGLDEVALEHRAECVEAINTFRRQHGLVPLAVCSRKDDYERLPVRAELSGAVVIEPLSREQVSTYLKQAGKPLAGVRRVLRDDETLWELLQTPLMLSIVVLAYQGRSAAEVRATGSLEQRRTHLLANYTERMFERRTKVTGYSREQTIRWLSWLARSMMNNNLGIFYLEWMQPDWLASRAQRLIAVTVPSALSGLGLGLAVHVGFLAVSIVDSAWVREMPSDLAYELAYELAVWGIWLTAGGLIIGLVFGLLAGLGGKLDHITPRETLRWSWREAWRKVQEQQMPRWTLGILVLFIGPFGLLIGLESGLCTGLGFVLSTFLSASGIIFLIPGLMFGFTAGQINFRTIPNEGIRRSLRNALISFLAALLLVVLVVVLITVGAHLLLNWSLNLSQRQLLSLTLPVALYNGLVTGLYCGVVKALRNGGFACLQHYTLRLMFWGSGYTPRNYIQFLDYAVERIFLRSVGGGYIFTHRLLMEYFATLQPADEATRLHSV